MELQVWPSRFTVDVCTLVLAWQQFETVPLAVAANRDESFDRSASPPGIFRTDPQSIAPRDEQAGGTWIGFNECGVFAGITNRWLDDPPPASRSRGTLVADVLATESAAEAGECIERATSEDSYAGFNLVVADPKTAVCFSWDGTLSTTEFDPGVHAVVNVAVNDRVTVPSNALERGARQYDNARAVRRELAVETDESVDGWLDRAGSILADHRYGVCIHGDRFGTRSSSLLALGGNTEPNRYRFADGPPCTNTYQPVSLDGEGHI